MTRVLVPLKINSRWKYHTESRAVLKKIDSATQKATKRAELQAAEEILAYMQEPGKPVTYPINWDSPKQRRYVMWLLRSTNNLPYKRTGRYNDAWKIVPARGGYKVINKWKGSPYVAGKIDGTGQSKIHKGRWHKLSTAVRAAVKALPKKIMTEIKIAVRKLGFRVKNDG